MDGWKILWEYYEQEGPPHLMGGKFSANSQSQTDNMLPSECYCQTESIQAQFHCEDIAYKRKRSPHSVFTQNFEL